MVFQPALRETLRRLSHLAVFALILTTALQLFSCRPAGNSSTANASASEVATGNPEIDALTDKIRKSPNDAALIFARADKFYQADMFEQAQADLQRAITINPKEITYYHLLADAYLDGSQSRKALETMQEAAKLAPERIPTLLKLSEFQLILKRYEESKATVQQILTLDKNNSEAFFMLGMNHLETSDTLKAIEAFQTCVENDPDNKDAYLELGNLIKKRNGKMALQYFNNALRIDSVGYNTLFNVALFYQQQNNFAQAKNYYDKAIQYYPQEPDAILNLGVLYLDRNDLKNARQRFEMCIKIDPTYAECYYFRGVTSEAAGDKQKAIADYEQCLSFDPEYADAKEALQLLGVDTKVLLNER